MKKVKIGDVCDILNGFAFKSDKYVEKGIRIIRIANVQKGFIEDNVPTFYPMDSTGLEKYMLKEDDLLMSLTGNVGRVALLQKEMLPAALNQRVACLRLKTDRITKGFLFHILNSDFFEQQCVLASNGVAQKNMSTEWLKDYEIPLYSIQEQMKIADILDKTKRIIVAKNNELRALNELIKARFVEMFGTLHDNENGFDIVTIEDVCSLIKDGTHQTPQYTEDKKEGYKFLSSKDVMSQKVDWTNIKYIPAELHEKLYATIKPQRNDILMSKNGVNYGVAAVNDTDEVFDIYVSLALLRPKKIIDPVFLKCVINNPETKWQFDSSIKGIGVPNLHLGEIKKTRMFLPPIELQNQFADFVRAIDKSKVNYYYKNRKDGFPPLLLIYSVTTIINLSDY